MLLFMYARAIWVRSICILKHWDSSKLQDLFTYYPALAIIIRRLGIEEKYYADGEDAVAMRKDLL